MSSNNLRNRHAITIHCWKQAFGAARGGDETMTENQESDTPNEVRRTLLKTLAAAGVVGSGTVAASGSAAARDRGSNMDRLVFEDSWSGEIVEETDVVDNRAFPTGTDATFDGKLVLEEIDVDEDDYVTVSGRLKGRLSGNPTQQINEAFETVIGLLEDVLAVLSPESDGECPILELVVGEIFLDLLGLQVETSVIEIDITAVAGPGNLLGNLLCAVAGLLDP